MLPLTAPWLATREEHRVSLVTASGLGKAMRQGRICVDVEQGELLLVSEDGRR